MYVQRSKTKAKRKRQKFRNISDNGNLDWLLHQNVFPLRVGNSILSGKGKGFIFKDFLEVHSLSLL